MVRALVTGGAGFIGSHLVERLLDDGHHVCVIDKSTENGSRNLTSVMNHPRLETHWKDITDLAAIRHLFKEREWVFHLAAIADIVPSIERPLEYHRTNVDGTVSVLEAARMANVSRIVYAASSSCYGIPDEVPTPESADIRPMYPYAFTKWAGEQYLLHWSRVFKLPCVSLRLFNVYGPRSRTSGAYGAVFGVFLAQKLAGEPLTIVGDGTQTRDFTFVSDVVDAFVKAAASDLKGEALNVGSGGTYSVNRLAELLGGETVHVPKRPGEPQCTFASVEKIQRLLAWRAAVPFEEGVARTLREIELWRGAPVWNPGTIADATSRWFDTLK